MIQYWTKKLSRKGFTLAELLIVVAIVAVMVAVSIPIFTSKLEKSRESTDLANFRAAKAAAAVALLDDNTAYRGKYFYYNIGSGAFELWDTTTPKDAYGKGTGAVGDADNVIKDGSRTAYDPNIDYTNAFIVLFVENSESGTARLYWSGHAGYYVQLGGSSIKMS